jgi:hypothetical protein
MTKPARSKVLHKPRGDDLGHARIDVVDVLAVQNAVGQLERGRPR